MSESIIIQSGNRRSVINGKWVRLEKLRNKKTPAGVWPETMVIDGVTRMNAAFLWALKGNIDFGQQN